MKNFKRILCAMFTTIIFASTFSVNVANADNITGKNEQETNEEIQKTYNQGKQKNIINDTNMSYDNFYKEMINNVIPAYNNYSKIDSNANLENYVADDNYEVPYTKTGDHPTTVPAKSSDDNGQYHLDDYTNAKDGYRMKSGDILVVHGSNDIGMNMIIGHAAIATSSKYIVHMPGKDHRAECWSKEHFFKHYANSNSHVWVYRIKSHPHYADDASTYAWHMYKDVDPSYLITTNLLHKDPSYCSKFVFLSYYWGATKDCFAYNPLISVSAYIVHPFVLPTLFSGSFTPDNIHRIVKYE